MIDERERGLVLKALYTLEDTCPEACILRCARFLHLATPACSEACPKMHSAVHGRSMSRNTFCGGCSEACPETCSASTHSAFCNSCALTPACSQACPGTRFAGHAHSPFCNSCMLTSMSSSARTFCMLWHILGLLGIPCSFYI
jgi:hypothetical protein